MRTPDSCPRLASAVPAERCRHCGRNKAVKRSRKLCHRCFLDPAVREAHPLVPNRFNQRGPGGPGRPLPDRPTDVPPGPGRVDVYAARVAAGFALWHPDDSRE